MSKTTSVLVMASLCWPIAALAQQAPAGNSSGTTVSSEQGRQVKVYRLTHAVPDNVARELADIFRSSDVQVFPDKGGNSVIVAGSPAMQAVAANLVRKYDVPQIRTALRPGPEPTGDIHSVRIPARDSAYVARTVAEMLANRTAAGEDATMAVVRAPPQVRQALEGLGVGANRAPEASAPAAPPEDNRGVKVLQLSSDQAAAIARALGPVLPSQGPKPSVILVVPGEGTRAEPRSSTPPATTPH
jgi:hypothetical protein